MIPVKNGIKSTVSYFQKEEIKKGDLVEYLASDGRELDYYPLKGERGFVLDFDGATALVEWGELSHTAVNPKGNHQWWASLYNLRKVSTKHSRAKDKSTAGK